MHTALHALRAGQGTPTIETTQVASPGRIEEQENRQGDRHASGIAEQAAQVIEGEQRATVLLDRMNTGMAQPDELPAIVAFLRSEMLHGACRVIEKALGGNRHA